MRTRNILLLLAILASFAAPAQNIDVKHYDIHINNINYDEHSIEAHTEVTFEATEDVSTIVLGLKQLTISELSIDYEGVGVANYEQAGDSVVINLNSAITPGTQAAISINYGGMTFCESSFGGVHWGSDIMYNLGVGFDSRPHNLGKTWFPCVDNMTDKATYDVYVTVADSLTAVCGGLMVNKTTNNDGTNTWHWNIPQEIATYQASVSVGRYVLHEDVYEGIAADIPINIFVKESSSYDLSTSFGKLKSIVALYEEDFGPYPFNRIGYCETTLGCMEHVDNIAFASSLIPAEVTGEEYVAHELAHMWFGNKVTCSTPQDMWLNEGFAQFCTNYFKKYVYDNETYINMITPTRDNIANWCDKEQNWIALNNIPEDLTYDGEGVYDRGAVVVATMMNYMGHKSFVHALRNYLERYAYSTASSEQLRDALTDFSGINMNGFFDTWVFTPGMPHFNVESMTSQANGNGYEATVNMSYSHRGASHIGQHNICNVTFIDKHLNTFTDTVCWDGEFAERTKQLDFEPVAAIADYNSEYLSAVVAKKTTITGGSGFTTPVRFFEISKDISDSVFIYSANHLVGPKETETDPALKISSRHYWSLFYHDYGNNQLTGRFTFSSNVWDNDIVTSASDSAVVLYRHDANEPWQALDCSNFEGNWALKRFTISNLQPGDYVLGAWDTDLLDVKEKNTETKTTKVFPNPASSAATIEWEGKSNGTICICDEKGQQVTSQRYNNTNQININTAKLNSGTYTITRIDKNGKKDTNKLIIKQ